MDITHKAKELGSAIADSKELLRMRKAEAAIEKDETASKLMKAHAAKRQEFIKLKSSGKGRKEQIEKVGSELKSIGKDMERNRVIKEYMDTAKKFNNVLQQVNGILQYYITGESSDCKADNCGGCSFGCK